jgi:hypothetical protein
MLSKILLDYSHQEGKVLLPSGQIAKRFDRKADPVV